MRSALPKSEGENSSVLIFTVMSFHNEKYAGPERKPPAKVYFRPGPAET